MKGFTLIEIMVSVAVMGIMIGGGVFYMNRVNALQKIETAREEMISSLRMARNLSITNQKPDGFASTVTEVNVSLSSGGIMTVKPNSQSETLEYFSKDIADENLNVGVSGGSIRFEMYTGKLIGTTRVEINISSQELTSAEDKKIIINGSGLIDDE